VMLQKELQKTGVYDEKSQRTKPAQKDGYAGYAIGRVCV